MPSIHGYDDFSSPNIELHVAVSMQSRICDAPFYFQYINIHKTLCQRNMHCYLQYLQIYVENLCPRNNKQSEIN